MTALASIAALKTSLAGRERWEITNDDITNIIDTVMAEGAEAGAALVELTVDKTITSAQLLALNTTPIELVAAQGAGTIIVPKRAVLFLDYNTAAYDGIAAGEDLSFRYTDGSGNQVGTVETDPFLTSTADAYRVVEFSGTYTPTANAALVLHMLSGNIATGDSPLHVRTTYTVINVATLGA